MSNSLILQGGESAGAQVCGPAKASKRILVIDDDLGIRRVSAALLNRCGSQVDTAEDEAIAWDTLQLNS